MVEFTYNNSKNASMGYTSFELNCGYHLWVFFEDKYDTRYRFFLANELAMKLRELINFCHQNILHTQDLQKQAHNKWIKLWSYVLDKKVWLNRKHIKIKKNQKLKAKFFEPF